MKPKNTEGGGEGDSLTGHESLGHLKALTKTPHDMGDTYQSVRQTNRVVAVITVCTV